MAETFCELRLRLEYLENFTDDCKVTWLLPPFFLFALAFGGIIVPKLNLIKAFVCREYFIEQASHQPSLIFAPVLLGDDNPQCEIPEVQILVTRFTLWMTVITGGLSAIVSPKLGALSDRYGRLRMLVITSFGGLMTELVTILVATYPDTIKYQWVLLGSILDGLCGSFTAGSAIMHAYAADCTAPPKRAVAFGQFHACLFSGIAFGPLLAAALLKSGGTLLTIFYVALGVHSFFIIFMVFVAPESLSKKTPGRSPREISRRRRKLHHRRLRMAPRPQHPRTPQDPLANRSRYLQQSPRKPDPASCR